jgi:membrane protein DedA with SNARE-associated domain
VSRGFCGLVLSIAGFFSDILVMPGEVNEMRRWVRVFIVMALLGLPVVIVSLDYLEDFMEANGQGVANSAISLIINLPRSAISLASEAGYAGIFILMLMEAAALPIPSEIILPFAGYLVYIGKLQFFAVLFVSILAALIGSFVDYYLGLKLGRGIFTASSRIPFVDMQHVRSAEAWFHRYGPMAVAIFRLMPAARVMISFPAGVYRMNKPAFAIYTLAGCLPWNITLICLGWWLGASWNTVVEAFRYINLVAYGLLALFIMWIGWRLVPRKQMSLVEVNKPAQA